MLQKLEEFEKTNKVLRRMLRDMQQKEEEELQLRQQQEVLLRKLTDADARNEVLSSLGVVHVLVILSQSLVCLFVCVFACLFLCLLLTKVHLFIFIDI